MILYGLCKAEKRLIFACNKKTENKFYEKNSLLFNNHFSYT